MSKTLDHVFVTHRDEIYRFALGMMNDKDEASDILLSGYEKVKVRTSTGPVLNVKSYLFMTVRNLCLDRLKVKSRLQDLEAAEDRFIDGRTEVENKDQVTLVRNVLGQLPPVQRSVILMKDIEGYEYIEVAITLNMSLNSVRANLSLARKRVREIMKKMNDYGKQ